MDAPAMSLELHEHGIHAVWAGRHGAQLIDMQFLAEGP
jgi:hypothetical protein